MKCLGTIDDGDRRWRPNDDPRVGCSLISIQQGKHLTVGAEGKSIDPNNGIVGKNTGVYEMVYSNMTPNRKSMHAI